MKDVLVSVCCLAYNHEKYIRETLEGFVAQKTNFKYEIIIHDDASPDGTADIIREYEKKYPDLFITICQEENQYSKGIRISRTFIAPRVSGKYVVLCEGDDFWDDELKLQRQVDALENHEDCYMCVHATREIHENGTPTGAMYPACTVQEGPIRSKDFLGMGYAFHTSSYMFRATQWKEYMENPPMFTNVCDVGDEAYLLYFGQLGNVYYIDAVMSNYRRGVPSSWSARKLATAAENRAMKHSNAMFETYKLFDEYTGRIYHETIARRMALFLFRAKILEKNASYIFLKENREFFACAPLKWKCMAILSLFLPDVAKNICEKRNANQMKQKGY